jgi:hypothetical protein
LNFKLPTTSAPSAMFSIEEQFNSAVVLLTGATGCVGGLVLESLLRTTNVAKVFVLLRKKGSSSAEERLSQLLQVRSGWQLRQLQKNWHRRRTHVGRSSMWIPAEPISCAGDMSSQSWCDLLQKSIFHKVRDQQQLLAKVCAVDGDITQPGLGLAPGIAKQLQQQLQIVLHCAADIRLEVSRRQDEAAAPCRNRDSLAAVALNIQYCLMMDTDKPCHARSWHL